MHIRVPQHAADRVGRRFHLSGKCQNALGFRSQHMCAPSSDILKHAPVSLKFRLLPIKTVHRLIGDPHDFRREKRGSAHDRHISPPGSSDHILIITVPRVFIASAIRICKERFHSQRDLVLQFHGSEKRLRIFTQFPAETEDLLRELLQGLIFPHPVVIRFI